MLISATIIVRVHLPFSRFCRRHQLSAVRFLFRSIVSARALFPKWPKYQSATAFAFIHRHLYTVGTSPQRPSSCIQAIINQRVRRVSNIVHMRFSRSTQGHPLAASVFKCSRRCSHHIYAHTICVNCQPQSTTVSAPPPLSNSLSPSPCSNLTPT